jgi:ribosomal-protein-alanine N-acetyltransferase
MFKYFTSFFHLPADRPKPPMDMRLIGPRVVLRMADPSDWRAWRALRNTSRDFLVPWEPLWPENALGYNFFCGLLRRNWRDWRMGHAYAFLVFLHDGRDGEGNLVGGISLNDIQRGIGQKGTLGYWVGKPFAGQGLMTEATNLVCDFAFNSLRLHRVEASCLPHNEPSKKLLQHLGFEEEGYAKAYLQINGKWEDHVLWGRTAPRPQHSV